MNIDKIVTEEDALEQLRSDSQKSMYPTDTLLRWLDEKDDQWAAEFDKLDKLAKRGGLTNEYNINKLIGLSILLTVVDKFKNELKQAQLVDHTDPDVWYNDNYGNKVDWWLKD